MKKYIGHLLPFRAVGIICFFFISAALTMPAAEKVQDAPEIAAGMVRRVDAPQRESDWDIMPLRNFVDATTLIQQAISD